MQREKKRYPFLSMFNYSGTANAVIIFSLYWYWRQTVGGPFWPALVFISFYF